MDANKIERIRKLNAEIENFRSCYEGSELWGGVESCVSAEKLLAFLIKNPHFQQIADSVAKLDI